MHCTHLLALAKGLTHRCPPGPWRPAGAIFPPLAHVGIQSLDLLWRPGRRHSQWGWPGSPCAACVGSPAPGSDLGTAGAPTSKSAKIVRKWPASRRASAAPCAPQKCCPCIRRAGKVRPHAGQWPDCSGGGAGGHVRQRKLARAARLLLCLERLSAQAPTGLQWAPSPQVVDDRCAERQGELVARLCQQGAADRTCSGPAATMCHVC